MILGFHQPKYKLDIMLITTRGLSLKINRPPNTTIKQYLRVKRNHNLVGFGNFSKKYRVRKYNSFHKNWYAYTAYFHHKHFNLVGNFYNEHALDLQPLQMKHIDALVSQYNDETNVWGSLDSNNLRVQRRRSSRDRKSAAQQTRGLYKIRKKRIKLLIYNRTRVSF